jgi:hypothetical protein
MMAGNLNIRNIYSLTSEEITTGYIYLKQWRSNLFDLARTDEFKVVDIINRVYKILELPDPTIVFSKGFNNAVNLIKRSFPRSNTNHYDFINCNDYQTLIIDLYFLVIGENKKEYYTLSPHAETVAEILGRDEEIFEDIRDAMYTYLYNIVDDMLNKLINTESGLTNNCYLQYCIEQLKLPHNLEAWDILKNLTQQCPYIIPLSKFFIVIERPIEIYLNNEQLPHNHTTPAIIFGDGSRFYYYHGISIPEQYGKISIDFWQPKWILEEGNKYNRSVLIRNIGYKRFNLECPDSDFWKDYAQLLDESIDIIIDWQLYHYNQLCLKQQQPDDLQISTDDAKKITEPLPFKLSKELYSLYSCYNGGYQLIPSLTFYPLKQAIQALSNLTWIKSATGYPFPLFQGDKGEIYYILADDPQPTYSHIYCVFPGQEPMVYAECVSSLIMTISQCYQEGAYYINVDEETGERTIEQDLDKIEPIFEKFNPDQIDNWRKIWKS